MSLGDRIADLRRVKGWTQARLATESGLSASAIAMYETNRRHPDVAAMDKLMAVLGATLAGSDTLTETNLGPLAAQVPPFEGAPDNQSDQQTNVTHLALTREEARLILFVRMNPRSKSFLEDYMMADESRRQQLEKTWRLINDFQPT